MISLFSQSPLFAKDSTMHPLFTQAAGITHDVIGAAIEVCKDKRPGLLEAIYEWCLTMELERRDTQSKIKNRDHWVQAISTPRATPIRFVDR